MSRWMPSSALLTLVLAACAGEPAQSPGVTTEQEALVTFGSCAELETYIKDTAVLQMRESLEGYGRYLGGPPMAEDASASAPGQKNGPDHSETTTQVAGVDEADLVKTDGHRVFYLVGKRLLVLKSWPANQTALASTTEVEGYPTEMFLSGSSLVVFSRVPQWTYDPSLPSPEGQSVWGWDSWYWYADGTKVSVYDVATDVPALTGEYYLGGGYASARRIGSVVRLVLSGDLRWPAGIKYWLDTWSEDEEENQQALEALKAHNEAKIRAQPLAQWLPRSFRTVAGQRVDVSADCTRYHTPTVGARLGLATVATLDLAHPATLDLTSVLSEVGEIYANHQSLYIAAPQWGWGWFWGSGSSTQQQTWLHKFSLAQPDRVSYLASGAVPGTPVDQFSLDEHQGYLRVATTLTDWSAGWQDVQTENRVYVLGQSGRQLLPVGSTPPIAPGERIYSSRFVGPKGYVVTYKQIDPLFTLDLSDPAQPRVMGELHIPGFSTYIQPLDDGHLLTVGMDTVVDPVSGRETSNGVALQIFDVTDLANPRLTAKTVVGTRYGYSESLWDHKAFNYFPKTGVLAIPFTDWIPGAQDYWGSFVSQLKLFHVSAAGAVTPMGAVDHRDLYQQWNQTDWYWWYAPYIRRSVQIEGYVYSFSYAGVKVNPVSAPGTVTALVPVPPEQAPTAAK